MTTINPTVEEMNKRVVRWKTIRPKQSRFEQNAGIPPESIAAIAAKSLYLYMGPEGLSGSSQSPGVSSADGLVVNIAKCPAGQGPELHAHARTIETFMTLRGTFEITWGDKGDNVVRLEELDLISVPPRVMRAFRNCGTEDALLLVLIQGENRDLSSDVQYQPALGDKLASDYGPEVRAKIEGMGWRFDAELGSDARAAHAQAASSRGN